MRPIIQIPRGMRGAAILTLVIVGSAGPYATKASAQSVKEEARDVIIVTGTRIPRPDAKAASPVSSFDRNEINMFRDLNIEGFLNDLPQVTPDTDRTTNNGGGIANINLRGLGSERTLILINGRRVAPSGTTSSVDVNTIPSALMHRIEVVSGGASAVYGSDAIAGAVNFITRDDLQGVEIASQFDIYGVGDGESYNFSIAAGSEFADGHGRVSVYGDYLHRPSLRADSREFTSVIIGEDRVRGELIDQGSFRVPEGAIFFPTAMLDGQIVFPIFNQDGSFRELLDEDTYNFAPDNFLQTPLERWSGGAFIDFELNPDIDLFAELMLTRPIVNSQLAPGSAGFTAQFAIDSNFFADSTREELRAAYDPDGDGIGEAFVAKRLDEIGPRFVGYSNSYYRGVVGFQAAPVPAWTIDGYYSFGQSETVESFRNDASRSRILQGLLVDPMTGQCTDTSGGCVPVNLFGRGNLSPEAADFIRAPDFENNYRSRQHNAALIATGKLFDWAGRPALVSGGVEFRRNTAAFLPSPISLADTVVFNSTGDAIEGAFNVYEAFSEVVVPLMEGKRFFERLEIEAGGRFSQYSTAGGSWTWKAGGQWFPLENLRFRGMWQRAVRAPNIEEAFTNPSSFTPFINGTEDFCLAVNDPIGRGLTDVCVAQGMDAAQVGVFDVPTGVTPPNFFVPVSGTSGGNPNLQPETAGTITAGAEYIFDMPFLMRIGVDYFDIRLEGAIARANDPLGLCALTADPESELCLSLTRTPDGTPLTLTFQPLNLAVARVKGVDINLNFSASVPNFMAPPSGADISIRSNASYYLEHGQATTVATPFVDCAGGFELRCGFSDSSGGTFPDKLISTTLSYDTPRWGASIKWRWIAGQEHLAPVFDALANLPAPNLPIPFIDDKHYLDAAIRFDVFENIQLRAGVDNLLAADPPLLANEASQINTDPSRYDVFGRRIFVGIEAQFGEN